MTALIDQPGCIDPGRWTAASCATLRYGREADLELARRSTSG